MGAMEKSPIDRPLKGPSKLASKQFVIFCLQQETTDIYV